MSRARFTLHADISDFYASIYTHSIEWALSSKANAKGNLNTPTLIGNQLDRAIRNGQDGQTKGIPVGPDTSFLVSEIILCRLDIELQTLMPNAAAYVSRFVDDLEVCAATRGEAEDALVAWDRALSAFDLSLNPLKTRIDEGPPAPERPWRSLLSKFELRRSSDREFSNDLRTIFSLAFDLQRQYPTDSVLSYTIQRVRPWPAGRVSWKIFEQLCLASAIADPSCIEKISRVFTDAKAQGLEINKDHLAKAMNEMCSYHAPYEHGSEVTWSLAIIQEHNLPLFKEVADVVARMTDNASLLLLWSLVSGGYVQGGGPDLSDVVARAEHDDAWRSRDWLLAYEAARNSWASDARLKRQPQWDELLKLNVPFFESVRELPAPRRAAGAQSNTASAGRSSGAAPPSTGSSLWALSEVEDDAAGDGEEVAYE